MKTLKDYNFAIIGLSEGNIHWLLLNPEDFWEERISGHWGSRNSVIACNFKENSTKVWQKVGCLQISAARTTDKVLSMGSYTSGLGLWLWTHYRGKHNLTLRVITVYRPCITNSSEVQTIYHQHQSYIYRTKDGR